MSPETRFGKFLGLVYSDLPTPSICPNITSRKPKKTKDQSTADTYPLKVKFPGNMFVIEKILT